MRIVAMLHLLAVALLLVVSTGQAIANHVGGQSRKVEEENIRSALFDHLLKTLNEQPTDYPAEMNGKPVSSKDEPPLERFTVYYLAIDYRKDPSDSLMKRFANHKPPVRKVSESFIDRHAPHPMWSHVRDKSTNEAGRIYSIGEIKWVDRNTVEVRGGSHAGGLNDMWSVYTLKRKGNGWKVTRMKDVIKA